MSTFFLIQTKISGSFCSNAENYGPGKTRDIFDTVNVDAICLTYYSDINCRLRDLVDFRIFGPFLDRSIAVNLEEMSY